MSGVTVFSKRRFVGLETIGEGAFGTAYKAVLKTGKRYVSTQTVAIKILKANDWDDAWSEINRMKELNHPNILKLIGVSSTRVGEIPWIITEYMQFGDLLSYIRSYVGNMTAYAMVKFAYGIACGMEYLHHCMAKVHGDLAARNCFVGSNCMIKIGDFGKIDESYEHHYYDPQNGNKPCPIRWMPPENLPLGYGGNARFTRKGDVWAYGVVLFEIWTRGNMPYDGLNDFQVLNALQNGENPGDYSNVSARWYIRDLMNKCWECDRGERPNFKFIKRQFEDIDGDIVNNNTCYSVSSFYSEDSY